MTKAIPYLIQGKNIILVVDSKSHTISRDTHISYNKIVEALKEQRWDDLRDLIEPKKAIVNFGAGHVSIEGDEILWKGQPFHNSLSKRMIEMYLDGFPIDPMVRFMENLMKNPSKRSVDQMYSFLERNNLPLTEDGHFLAFKKVRKDNYNDIHSNTIYNGIGAIVEMERNNVDDNPDSYCSSGLHFCSESYLQHFGSSNDPVMILKINPADVVSVPKDYNGAKGRCCRYEVVGQVNGAPAEAFAKVINGDYSKKEEVKPAKPPKKAVKAIEEALTKPVMQAAWPFPNSKAVKAAKVVAPEDELYDLVRVHGGAVEFTDMSYLDAIEQVQRNVDQKKAKLKIVKAGTDEEV